MKYLVAFALIAAAAALPEPVRLLAPAPIDLAPAPIDIAPLMVPQVMDDIALTVKVVDAPEAPQAVEDPNAYAVNFVEEAANVEASPALVNSAYAVNFVDEAVNAQASPLKAVEDVSAYAVNVINEVNAEAAVNAFETSAFAVNFVDVAVEAPVAVKIMDIPLPESVVLPLDSVVLPSVDAVMVADSPVKSSDAVFAVKVVDVADVNEETPSFMPIKQFPDPRWR